MTIERSDANGMTVFALKGRLDATTATTLDRTFSDAFADGARQCVWDLSELEYISSAGLRSVLQSLKRLNAAGGSLALCALAPMVQEVFDISGFRSLLTIHPDRATALAATGK